MSSRRNIILISVGVIGIAISGYFYKYHKNFELKTTVSALKEDAQNKQAVILSNQTTIPAPITKKMIGKKGIASTDQNNVMEDFSRTILRNGPEHIYLVENVLASNLADIPLKKITKLGGITFYDAQSSKDQVPGLLPVVFNSKTGEYGMLSGEIIIRHYYKKAKDFALQAGITIVSDDPRAYTLIIREDDLDRLQDLLGEAALDKSKPRLDVIYHLNQPN